MPARIELLAARHRRDDFNCGESALDEFLRRYARQQAERDFSRTYVAVAEDGARILGFHTVSSGAIDFRNGPPGLRLPRYPIPVARIGRLAVDVSAQGTGIGAVLLEHALRLATTMAEQIGLHAVVVDAKHAKAAAFYAHYGFQTFPDNGLSLFLMMSMILRLQNAKL
ncbi:MAG: GNAT family N-acetyltransferase [Burkholderiaceae bacterium]|nr:GNAT family N-acetyltransferase [Sulfuritalea sp.]MCF8174447.1 GNAT family N-acetyltransferase [Burkholderiaceae bacterium]MCF8184862.1 GNAT family N-acetyltransferase [Polynucleobacter sp.]